MKAEAYLVKDVLITFGLPKADSQKVRQIDFLNLHDHYSLEPVDGGIGSDVLLASKLQTIFSDETAETKKNLQLSLSTLRKFNGHSYDEKLEYFTVQIRSAIFQNLLMSLGDQMQLKLELRNAEVELPSPNPPSPVTTSIMNWDFRYEPTYFSGKTDNFPPRWSQYWNASLSLHMKFSVRVSIIVCGNLVLKTNDNLGDILQDGLYLTDEKEHIPKKLLEEKIATNITILIPDGSKLECHKSFLISQSLVFQTMLTGGKYKERESQEIEIADMTENGVKALFAFLYYRGLEEPVKDLKVAVELLRAANKYDISSLEKAVATIILQKPVEWFDIATTIEMFFFSKNVEQLVMVKLKSLRILKSKMADLTASIEFKQLFEDVDDVKRVAARELSTALLNM